MTDQRPLGSGFGATSTAAEVVAGLDLTGHFGVVTGGYSGIGLEVVRALVGAGAEVVVPARRPPVAEDALEGLRGVEVVELDLAEQESVASAAAALVAAGRPVDWVVNNAGVMACAEGRVGPGWELQLATNHLGHFALVNRLWPLLHGHARAARVISVSSLGHHLSGFRWDDPWFATGYDKWLAYGQSKTANILFAVHLDRVGREQGVRAFSLHPGAILTQLGRHLGADDIEAVLVRDETGRAALPEFKSPEQGAATVTWAATSPQLDGRGGDYLEDCDIGPVAEAVDGIAHSGVAARALDPAEAARLWRWSAEQTGVDAFRG